MQGKWNNKNVVGVTACAFMSLMGMGTNAARAQELPAQFAVRGGFHLGNDFNNNGARNHLEGFEIGADLPIIHKVKYLGGVYFSPTITFGGSNRSGADTDGNIYRFLVNAKYGIANTGAYGGLGLGYSFTQARVHEFRNVNGFATEYLLGYNFRVSHPKQTQPFLELTYHDGEHNQLRGFSFNVGARF